MKLLLLYPPFADPTQPYLSLPVLKGYLAGKGHTIRCLDLNIAAARWLLSGAQISALQTRVDALYRSFNRKSSLNAMEQLQYCELAQAVPALRQLTTGRMELAAAFKRTESFYDYAGYFKAVRDAESVFQALSSVCFPYRFGFNQAGHFILPWDFSMLTAYYTETRSPLSEFYPACFPAALLADCDLIGISLTFMSQLAESLYLCRWLKQRKPALRIVLGGACISQLMHSAPPNVRRSFFAFADAVCIGEGEETLDALLSGDTPAAAPNLLTPETDSDRLCTGPARMQVLDIRALPAPDYSDFDLDAYLAPSRLLLYAPTRNCYWHKCSFCTYGFSYDRAYPYREIPVAKVVADLALLKEKYGTAHFYFSCDVLSPQYASDLAAEITRQKLEIRWATDLRMEAAYTSALCTQLYAAGLRAAAFGIESGSDRMLGIIGKGISSAVMRESNRNFHAAGIATQWMTFTYHPQESAADAIQTLTLLRQEQEVIDLFIAGEFQLVPGSRIMRQPGTFGIRDIYYLKGDQFRFFPYYTEEGDRELSTGHRESIDNLIERLAGTYALKAYPWAGAISTHHTFLYFMRFGQRVFAKKAALKQRLVRQLQRESPQETQKSVFPFKQLELRRTLFYEWIRKGTLPGRGKNKNRMLSAPLCASYLDLINSKIKPINHINRR